jgi:hypothetical protein
MQQFRPRAGHFENPLVLRAAAAALFSSPTAPGVLYSSYFKPKDLPSTEDEGEDHDWTTEGEDGMSDNTVAFILANVSPISEKNSVLILRLDGFLH